MLRLVKHYLDDQFHLKIPPQKLSVQHVEPILPILLTPNTVPLLVQAISHPKGLNIPHKLLKHSVLYLSKNVKFQ